MLASQVEGCSLSARLDLRAENIGGDLFKLIKDWFGGECGMNQM